MIVTTALTLLQVAYQLLIAAQSPNIQELQRQQAVSAANNAISYAQSVIQSQGSYNPYPYNPNPGQTTGSVQIIIASNGIENNFQRNKSYQIVWTPSNPSLGAVDVELLNTNGAVMTFLGRSYSNSVTWVPNVATGNYTLRVTQNGTVLGTRSVVVF